MTVQRASARAARLPTVRFAVRTTVAWLRCALAWYEGQSWFVVSTARGIPSVSSCTYIRDCRSPDGEIDMEVSLDS